MESYAIVAGVAFIAGVIVDHLFGSKILSAIQADVKSVESRVAVLEAKADIAKV